ncbi:sigma-54 dependent transcriptional regulator [Verrucomicrobium sp. BvORR106]|uniref:sigma-54 interaction domain-containing protein n=1 Tax=Verrucomicrobium sp. BvORR106 TaxID=1403819 RepID=UPI00056EF743|nr:sigma-54 dependent transcriptional regulator [Verrucomicrobium sp. BvORR106]
MPAPSKSVLTLPNVRAQAAVHRASLIVFEDPKSLALMQRIELIAPSDANALIVGETGTGKEIIARHLHDLSARSRGPFVAVNCGAFSETLVESELFGHERGAFTGATVAKPGWFETAHGGTLFLDEIGDLPLPLQVKLLRVLQERQVVRIGSRKPVEIDVRLVAATNVHLEEAVAAGRFREDLYYRLKVAAVDLPSLRERPGDILPLARHFLRIYGERLGVRNATLSPVAEQQLVTGHSWPGNIRELENVIHHALLVSKGRVIRPEDLNLASLRPRTVSPTNANHRELEAESRFRSALLALFEEGGEQLHLRVEDLVINTAYEYCHRNQLQTARLLGISRNIVRARLVQSGQLLAIRRHAETVEAS